MAGEKPIAAAAAEQGRAIEARHEVMMEQTAMQMPLSAHPQGRPRSGQAMAPPCQISAHSLAPSSVLRALPGAICCARPPCLTPGATCCPAFAVLRQHVARCWRTRSPRRVAVFTLCGSREGRSHGPRGPHAPDADAGDAGPEPATEARARPSQKFFNQTDSSDFMRIRLAGRDLRYGARVGTRTGLAARTRWCIQCIRYCCV